MENPTVSELRSRSRSKTPFLRSSCDRENCTEGEDHAHHKSGRRTPVRRSTPIKQLHQPSKMTTETISEETEGRASPPAHRTRLSMKATTEKLVKTSDYSSEESLDRLKSRGKEIFQNEINSEYERVSTSAHRIGTLADLTLSPIHAAHHVTYDRSSRIGSPAYSASSTDSSFAEQALADTSTLLDRDPNPEHLPYRLYKMAGEYWNKYPKTDYTYSPMSRDRVELAPGLVAVPNMSRRSLSAFRVQGPNTSADDEQLTAAAAAAAASSWTATTLRKRYTSVESSDDESYVLGNGGPRAADRRWWITQMLVAVLTSVTGAGSAAYRRLAGPDHRYPYTDRRPANAGVVSRAASLAAAPFYWLYCAIKQVVTTTVTTVTETITPNHVSEREKYIARSYQQQSVSRRRWWPWFLLLLLPAVGYGSYYTYENFDSMAMPNFTDFTLDLSEFTALKLPSIALPSMPNITLPSILPNLTMPEINITLPDIRENMPEVTKTYNVYKDIVQNRMADASEYVKVVADSCYEEMRRFWRGVLG